MKQTAPDVKVHAPCTAKTGVGVTIVSIVAVALLVSILLWRLL
jgi:hypothetical protein